MRKYRLECSDDNFEFLCEKPVHRNPLNKNAVVGQMSLHLAIKLLRIQHPAVAALGMGGIRDNHRPLSARHHYIVAAVVDHNMAFGLLNKPLFSSENNFAASTTLLSKSTIVSCLTSGNCVVAPEAMPPPKHIISTSCGSG